MPAYGWLYKDKTDFRIIPKKLSVMKSLRVPYTDADVATAEEDARKEAGAIAAGLVEQGAPAGIEDKEIIALIAYLQRLGQDFRKGVIK
jgi:cytochrome c oxidase cbb3-type subunit I/II